MSFTTKCDVMFKTLANTAKCDKGEPAPAFHIAAACISGLHQVACCSEAQSLRLPQVCPECSEYVPYGPHMCTLNMLRYDGCYTKLQTTASIASTVLLNGRALKSLEVIQYRAT